MKSGKRKTRDTDNQEDWLGDVSGCTSYEDAAWLCSINGGIHKNQIINERLAWNVGHSASVGKCTLHCQ